MPMQTLSICNTTIRGWYHFIPLQRRRGIKHYFTHTFIQIQLLNCRTKLAVILHEINQKQQPTVIAHLFSLLNFIFQLFHSTLGPIDTPTVCCNCAQDG